MMWETGKSMAQELEMKTCNYDESYCYDVRTVPMIESVSANTGYTTGGQNMTIKGYGIGNGRLNIQVDGTLCQVTSRGRNEVSCNV
jgi:hypothetical protein